MLFNIGDHVLIYTIQLIYFNYYSWAIKYLSEDQAKRYSKYERNEAQNLFFQKHKSLYNDAICINIVGTIVAVGEHLSPDSNITLCAVAIGDDILVVDPIGLLKVVD